MLTRLPQKLPGSGDPIFTHAGFLSCTKHLLPILEQEITRQVAADKDISNIVFTGHSAGGAVSSLAFLHFVYHTPPASE